MSKISLSIKLLAGVALGASLWAARRIAYAPPSADVAVRAQDATRSGPWRHNYATINGVRLHFADVGSGPLVILLHGFPQCWYQWRYIIPHLAEHFHVVAPDMRGYNESDKPAGIASYTIEALTQDIASLIEALGEERAHIVGHDWGGGVTWGLGMQHSHRVDSLVVLNSPHPAAFERELKKGKQLLRSWYIFFFQLPLLPETSMRLNLRRSLPNSAQVPGAFPEEALDVYEDAISQPGAATAMKNGKRNRPQPAGTAVALQTNSESRTVDQIPSVTAMLNYYRASFRDSRRLLKSHKRVIEHPTMVIWGMKDFALVPELIEGLERWVPNLRLERIQECGHWVPEEKPALVSDLLLDFLLR